MTQTALGGSLPMEMLDLMKQRHSVRQYTDRPIEVEKRNALNSMIAQINQKADQGSGAGTEYLLGRPDPRQEPGGNRKGRKRDLPDLPGLWLHQWCGAQGQTDTGGLQLSGGNAGVVPKRCGSGPSCAHGYESAEVLF